MSRLVSFVVLAAIVLVVGLLSYRVMAIFLLPMFLATLLVVLFRPLHESIAVRCGGRLRLAALLTTLSILLLVFVPTGWFLTRAASDAIDLVRRLDRQQIALRILQLRKRLNMNLPPAEVEKRLADIQTEFLAWRAVQDAEMDDAPPHAVDSLIAAATVHCKEIEQLLELPGPDEGQPDAPIEEAWLIWRQSLDAIGKLPADAPMAQVLAAVGQAERSLERFHSDLYGPPLLAWFKRQLHLDEDQVAAIKVEVQKSLGPLALGAPLYVGEFAVQLVIGLVVLVVSLYYFLADGPEMVSALMKLSPLDERYVSELLQEFAQISRAIVFAMLLAALAQGLLGGVGYYFAGLQSVFLLTVLTMLLSLVPFVGAGAVWVSCSLWLFFVDGNLTAAVGLALWGALVVSTVDNIVKPLVLHGQSNLHPLLALLSVLGGVQALGPIGIFVGPMVVALLYAVLVMLRREMTSLDTPPPPDHALQG